MSSEGTASVLFILSCIGYGEKSEFCLIIDGKEVAKLEGGQNYNISIPIGYRTIRIKEGRISSEELRANFVSNTKYSILLDLPPASTLLFKSLMGSKNAFSLKLKKI